MAEEARTERTANQETPANEKAGELLRRERINRRIAVETIARDLKLNGKYIKSLEACEYDQMPGEPYLRVYLRSIAKYLSLDPDLILKTYLRERGHDPDEYKASPNKITISMEKVDKPKVPWAIIGVLAGVLVIAAYVGSRMGAGEPQRPASDAAAAGKTGTDAQAKAAAPADTSKEDSLQAEQFKPVDTADAAARPAKPDSIVFVIQAVKDSSWIQVYADGKPTRTTIRQGASRRFVFMDSLNVRVGKSGNLKFSLNGSLLDNKTLQTPPGSDVVAFKVDRTGVTPWLPTKWVAVFKQ